MTICGDNWVLALWLFTIWHSRFCTWTQAKHDVVWARGIFHQKNKSQTSNGMWYLANEIKLVLTPSPGSSDGSAGSNLLNVLSVHRFESRLWILWDHDSKRKQYWCLCCDIEMFTHVSHEICPGLLRTYLRLNRRNLLFINVESILQYTHVPLTLFQCPRFEYWAGIYLPLSHSSDRLFDWIFPVWEWKSIGLTLVNVAPNL